uniref:VRK serine/threonine kinase 3 n=1 Tax=Gorilla gorilla gorilla TaxID=9595 RepID=A0A2I2ZJS4_GORGO
MISFCPDCGKSIQAAFKFCPYCGNSLPVEEHVGSQTFVNPHVSSFQASLDSPAWRRYMCSLPAWHLQRQGFAMLAGWSQIPDLK